MSTERKWILECQSETGVTLEALDYIRFNDFSAVDDKVKAFVLCFGKKYGLLKESGDIDVEKVKKELRSVVDSEDQINKIIGKCVVNKETKQETVFQAFKCVRVNKPDFLPV